MKIILYYYNVSIIFRVLVIISNSYENILLTKLIDCLLNTAIKH